MRQLYIEGQKHQFYGVSREAKFDADMDDGPAIESFILDQESMLDSKPFPEG